MLKSLNSSIWVSAQPQRFLGVEVGTRMSIIKLGDGSLVVYSPIALTEDLKAEVSKIGRVEHLVAPNCFHHLYIGEWQKAFPAAKMYVAPGLKEKRPDLQGAETLEPNKFYPWKRELDDHHCQGMPKMNEVVFFHKATGTLFIADLAFHFGPKSSLTAKIFALLTGVYNRLGLSKFDRFLFVRDKTAAQKTFEEILKWDIKTVVVCHGEIVTNFAKASLQNALLH